MPIYIGIFKEAFINERVIKELLTSAFAAYGRKKP